MGLHPNVASARNGELRWERAGVRLTAFLGAALIGHVEYDDELKRWAARLAFDTVGSSGLATSEEGAQALMEPLLLDFMQRNFAPFLEKHRRSAAMRPVPPLPGGD